MTISTSGDPEGPDLSLMEYTWIKVAESECRVQLLSKLLELNIGVNEVEDYNEALNLKLRSKTFTDKNSSKNKRGVVMEAMSLKLRDEQ